MAKQIFESLAHCAQHTINKNAELQEALMNADQFAVDKTYRNEEGQLQQEEFTEEQPRVRIIDTDVHEEGARITKLKTRKKVKEDQPVKKTRKSAEIAPKKKTRKAVEKAPPKKVKSAKRK